MKHYYDPQYQDAPDLRVLGKRIRIAKQQHKCCLCQQPIPIGHRYIRYAYLCDGKFYYDKTHLGHCDNEWGEP